MTINEIYINNFGKLSGFKLSAHDGVNIIYGENETGKTTVMAFIRAMFYGAGKGDARRRYEPWNGGRMGGTIVFECEGKHYSLSRQFGQTKSTDKVELWCKTTGEQITLPEKSEPGDYLLGINEMTFVNSVFIGQVNPVIAGSNDEILAKLMNLASSGDETTSRSEIEARLNEAAAKIDSKRSNAIIPALESERSALLEQRSQIVENVKKADELRVELKRLEARQTSMDKECGDLDVCCERQKKITRLKELDQVIEIKKSIENDEARYNKFHEALYGTDFSLSEEFVAQSRSTLEEIRNGEALIKAKRDQLKDCKDLLDSIDRSRFVTYKAIKRNRGQIDKMLTEYDDYLNIRADAERRLEEYESEIKASQLSPKNLMIIGGVIALGLICMGFVHWIFFLLGALVILGFAAFFFMKKKGIIAEPSSGIEIELLNIDKEIRDLNRANRKVLDEVGTPNVQALREEVQDMERVGSLTSSQMQQREKLKEEVAALEEDVKDKKDKLRKSLECYTKVESDDKAITIVAALDKMQREYAAIDARLANERETFEKLLGEQDYDNVQIEAELLREEIGEDNVDAFYDADIKEIEQRRSDLSAKLSDLKAEIAAKQTELSGCSTNIQDVEAFNDKIKLLNSKIEHYRFELDSINVAVSALGEAFETMQRDFGPIINFKAGRILDELTNGKYPSVFISERLVPSVTDGANSSNIRNCSSLSIGTGDQVYLALRLAIAGIVSDVKLPVLLDDAFAQYDDARVQSALFYLAKESGGKDIGQVIIFTCHNSVLKLAQETGIQNPIIKMPEE